jgi:hypothetical protein
VALASYVAAGHFNKRIYMSELDGGSQALQALLFKARDVISDTAATPIDLAAIEKALVELFIYLVSTEGRTSENCITAATFFQVHDDYGFNWFHLPEEFRLVLDDIGGRLHVTEDLPDIGTNLESSPELLLERIHSLND